MRWADRLAGDVVLADRASAGASTSAYVMSTGHLGELRPAEHLLHGQAFTAQRLGELVAPGLEGVLAALAGEPLADLVARPGALATICSQSRRRAGASTLEVKISHGVAASAAA